MITIRLNPISEHLTHVRDFLKSISYQSSNKDVYEIVYSGEFIGEFSDRINFVPAPNADSKIEIRLPDNCLVLGKDWDKYINYNLDNGKTIDNEYVKKKLGLVGRPDNGVFPGLEIEYPVVTS